MGVTSSLGTLGLDASRGRAVVKFHLENRGVGRDRLARKRMAKPGHACGLADLLAAGLLVDAAVERKELIERRTLEVDEGHIWTIGARARSVWRHEKPSSEEVLRRRDLRAAVEAPPDDRVFVHMHVEKLKRPGDRVLEAVLDGRR